MCTSFLAAFRIQNFDLVMGTSPPIFQAVSAWMAATIKRVPFLLEIRDLWPAFAVDMGVLKNPLLIKMSESLESFLYARANHIVVNSPAYGNYLMERGIRSDKVTLVPNGVDPQMFKPNGKGKKIRNKLGLHGKYVVTYAGALGMANDIPTLIKAAERLKHEKNVNFLLVGDGKDRNKLESMTETLKLENITFTGAVPKTQMPEYLAASNACVAILKNIPMFKTTYPNKVFDYMAAGRPTILVIDGVIRDVIEDAKGGIFVPPGDDSALAAAIRKLARDPEQANNMGRNAREYVIKNFNRKRHSQAFADLINRVAIS
jgi:glycosyltransferase involved in cell wall biosynthesis